MEERVGLVQQYLATVKSECDLLPRFSCHTSRWGVAVSVSVSVCVSVVEVQDLG
jgi:hypothetical protein